LCFYTTTQNGRKLDSYKSIIHEYGINKLRGRPRNGWQNEVREDGRLFGGEGWKERVYNREEWKKLLRAARIVAFCMCQ
jgi:hypothetical protein